MKWLAALLLIAGMGNGQFLINPQMVVPPDPSTTSLLGWWKTDAITPVADGTEVSPWVASFGSANLANLTAGQKPTYYANQINGKPILRFDGTTDWLRATMTIAGSSISFYAVLTHRSSGGNEWPIVISDGGDAHSDLQSSIVLYGNSTTVGPYWNSLWMSTVSRPALGTYYLYAAIYDGTGETTFNNGVAGTRYASSAMSFNSSFLQVGAGWFSGANWEYTAIDAAEILIYNVAHTATERQRVESYLKYKYALP